MSSTRRDRHWLPAAGVILALMAIGALPAMQQRSRPAAGAATESIASWKDPDGNPLPFQSDEEVLEFLSTAEVESIDDIDLGVTNPRQVVLHKDGVRMRAALRDYDETFTERRFEGVFYARLRDSFIFDIAAYRLSRHIGLNNVPPVVLRRIGGEQVSLQAWIEDALMETDRIAYELDPPSAIEFRKQQQNMRVFDTLIGNVDRNTGNILLDENWKFWLIDHSRAFMRNDETYYLERISGCSRWLYERLQELTFEELEPLLAPPLTTSEVEWLMQRRDKVIAHLNALIAERGEGAVLFESGE